MPWFFWRVYVLWPARCRCRIMSFCRAHSEIDWIAVQPITRSIITMQEPSCLANSPRRYISSIVPAVMLR